MPFKIIHTDEPRSIFHSNVQLDKSRDTAILIRQSRKGSHVAHYESRLLQESLIPFVIAAREESDLEHIRIFDEGSGVSGTKGPDKRKKVRLLFEDIFNNLIGDLVLARADRLFRDKHFANVSTFTQLAEKMGIKVIVPTPQGVIVYDMRNTKDLMRFQQDMQASYAYVDNQISYMNRARDNKVLRGLFGGGCLPLPYVLQRDMPKEVQVPVIYLPWLEPAIDLFQKFTDFNFETGRLAHYVEDKPYLFHFMPPLDLEIYKPATNLRKVEGGYTISTPKSLALYLSNLTLAGFAHGGRDEEGNTLLIEDAWEAVIPMDFLEPCYAAITGHFLDGTPFIQPGSKRNYRHEIYDIDGALHGLLISDNGAVSAFANVQVGHSIYACLKGGYLGKTTNTGLGRIGKAWTLRCSELDRIIVDRLIELAEYDHGLVERIREYFSTIGKEGEGTIAVLDTAIQNTSATLKSISSAIMLLVAPENDNEEKKELKPDDPLVKSHRELSATLHNLEKQRKEAAVAGKEDPSASIKNFYHILSHLRHEFFSKSPQTRKDIIRKLIEEVRVNVISPHLYTLNITWISPVSCGREDVALFWRSDPINDENLSEWTEDEETALRCLYPNSPQIELMKALPYKTPGMIKRRSSQLGIKRDRYHILEDQVETMERFYWTVCYADLQVAAAFTQTLEERSYLWGEINKMAENTKRGQLTASWFLPVDAVSFERALCVTDVNNDRASPGYP